MLEGNLSSVVFDNPLEPLKSALGEVSVKQAALTPFTKEISFISAKQSIPGHISITKEGISWNSTTVSSKNFEIPPGVAYSVLYTQSDSNFKNLQNCHKCIRNAPSTRFTIFGFGKDNRKAVPDTWTFTCSSVKEAEILVEKIRDFLQPSEARKGAIRNILLLLNPASGTKRALSIYEKIVLPMLEMAGVQHTLIKTERPLHAKEIAETYDYKQYDAAATISGDGLLHEFLNGVLARDDWKEARTTPIGIIPAGSGNALAMSVGTPSPELSTVNMITGSTRPFDIMVTKLADDSIRHSFVMATWGYVADVDIESEKLRWAGPARLTIYALLRLLNLRSYEGKIHYIPYDAPVDSLTSSDEHEDSTHFAYVDKVSLPVQEKLSEPWISRECSLSQFFALNIPWISTDFLACKHSRLNSGYIDLIWIEKVSSGKYFQIMLESAEGGYVDRDFVNHIRARAIILEPIGRVSKNNPSQVRQGILDVDGEVVIPGPIRIELQPGLCQLVAPSWLNESENTFTNSKSP
ncbi:hypothetical protein K493DRAFT_318044 [Basidiobolus meristosporus CBS 931.73]|uniref:DAGKc domain-containing protein n=1 Tax=Basidiobolus meristosporus CBS 931.73 TaxID=1314790 RepID=A0A1Y1XX72_9FUNG|nr:hypothetical protein K493DRAFT_318044 [Basidiobolus meristosporus CBS 931.73]|eukprot:ORX90341.1 hypothetical protein K493DRAFT_318044 [Basidiobolus meristosporus CBS 931.73]